MSTPLNPKKTALLLLDLQNGFLQMLSPDVSASVIENAASAITIARENGVQVAYIRAALNENEIQEVPDRTSFPETLRVPPEPFDQKDYDITCQNPRICPKTNRESCYLDNPVFSSFKNNKDMSAAIHPAAESTQIHPKVAPKSGDFVHRKTRFGAFMKAPSDALLKDFASHGIDTVIIGGVITSGALLSAVRQLADLDFQLFVLEDCSADHDPELHKVLCEKVFPSQAKVIRSTELESLF